MVTAPATRFRFDFDDLRPPTVELVVVEAAPPAVPVAVSLVAPLPKRPSWLPRLLPVFLPGRPLQVEIIGGGAFGGILLESLPLLLATAGAEANLQVMAIEGGFAVGTPRLEVLPAQPSTIVPADLTRTSVGVALEAVARRPGSLLVLNGDLRGLDSYLGIGGGVQVVRLPLAGRSELEAVRRGLPAGVAGRRFGLGCLALASALIAGYCARLA